MDGKLTVWILGEQVGEGKDSEDGRDEGGSEQRSETAPADGLLRHALRRLGRPHTRRYFAFLTSSLRYASQLLKLCSFFFWDATYGYGGIDEIPEVGPSLDHPTGNQRSRSSAPTARKMSLLIADWKF